MEKILTIKNNLSPKLVKRHLKRVADDEEKERAERAKQYQQTYSNSYYPNGNKPVTVYIYFYQWSTLDGNNLKTFTEYSTFFKFCADSNIILTEDNRTRLYNSNYNYVTCKTGKNELIISTTYCGLKDSLKRSDENRQMVLSCLPGLATRANCNHVCD